MLRLFENSVLSIIYRTMRDEVTGEWINLYNEELIDLNSPVTFVGEFISRTRDGRRV